MSHLRSGSKTYMGHSISSKTCSVFIVRSAVTRPASSHEELSARPTGAEHPRPHPNLAIRRLPAPKGGKTRQPARSGRTFRPKTDGGKGRGAGGKGYVWPRCICTTPRGRRGSPVHASFRSGEW
jgi:hypothetical protein